MRLRLRMRSSGTERPFSTLSRMLNFRGGQFETPELAFGGHPRRPGRTQLGWHNLQLVRLDPGRGPGAD
eukprot:7476323-Pyramimonas_sp.AAC.1